MRKKIGGFRRPLLPPPVEGGDDAVRCLDADAVSVKQAIAQIDRVLPLPLRRQRINVRVFKIKAVPGEKVFSLFRFDTEVFVRMPVIQQQMGKQTIERRHVNPFKHRFIKNDDDRRRALKGVQFAVDKNIIDGVRWKNVWPKLKPPALIPQPELAVAARKTENGKLRPAFRQVHRGLNDLAAKLDFKQQLLFVRIRI